MLGRLPPKFRAIDILVNNAGHDVGGKRPFIAGPADAWADIVETNLQSLLRVTRAVLPGMLERGGGDILNIGSVSGIKAAAQRAAYGASKAAVHMFSENLRSELAGTGVRVTEILPGLTRTSFAQARLSGDEDKAQEFYAKSGTPLEAEDIARAVTFALRQPPHVTIAELVIVPSAQG